MAANLPTHLFKQRQLITDPIELLTYEADAGFDAAQPDAVFYPHGTEDVSRIMRWASDAKVPLIARGAGTGLAGGAVAQQGGIIIAFSQMNRVLNVDPTGRMVTVQSGAVNLHVDSTVKRRDLYYPPDPASGRSSVIGGNIGTNAGGPHCFKYGVTTNYVNGMTIVLADGAIVHLGGGALDYPEYDLAGVVVGSEGTLAIVTEARLRLIRNPPGVKTLMVSFDSEAQAGVAVSAVIAAGLVPATLELMDQRSMRMIEEFTDAGLPVEAGAALIVEVDGYPEGLDAQLEEAADLFAANGGYGLRIAQSEEERSRIWYGRKSAAGAFSRIAPSYYLTDVTVRRSFLGEVLGEILAVCDKYNVQTANFFHAGDGNLHPLILCDQNDAELMARVHQAGKEIIAICLERDGSISGEHGIGLEKRSYMNQMYTPSELAVMRTVKELFDPHNLCNPGKLLPDAIPPLDALQATDDQPDLLGQMLFTPVDAAAAASGLATLNRARRHVRIGGQAATGQYHAAVRLSTEALRGVQLFAPEDLFVTAGAGTTLAELQHFLAEHGKMTPLATPWPQMTLGGLVATNVNGPLRMRYGSIRDNLLCATLVLPNGVTLRTGRPLVKNAAGYDLTKLLVGSHGTLGLISDVTFKLLSLPRRQRTLVVPVPDMPAGIMLGQRLLPQALCASALLLVPGALLDESVESPYALIYSAEGLDQDVDAELAAVSNILRGAKVSKVVETERTGTAVWAQALQRTATDQLLLRVGIPPHLLPTFVTGAGDVIDATLSTWIDIAAGQLYLAIDATAPAQAVELAAAIRAQALAQGGYAVGVQVPQALADCGYDRWGYAPSSLSLMRRLKASWDPNGILGDGEGFVGERA